MADVKTRASDSSVAAYLDAIDDEARRADCELLTDLMARATKQPPRMWGTSIVGFGSRHYKYDSGREGDTCLVGFASRKGDIAVYGLRAAADAEELLANLGRHKSGKGCVYIRKLADIDLKALERLVTAATAAKRP
ncbi:MAG TPA: DUF1801 domain-containing protein [Thermoanaerobaculaceae bacterium]|nr:DUF1801 domain-containing protein [Thermoanaerobaculaceae bacterium]